jgi:lipid-binding SYLF domain-containing protein
MNTNLKTLGLTAALSALALAAAAWAAQPGTDPNQPKAQPYGQATPQQQQGAKAGAQPSALSADAQKTLDTFKQKDPSLGQQLNKVAGYAVFPKISKGAFIVGGAGGEGVLYEHGKPVGKLTMTNMSVGLQAGGQTYSQLMLFQDQTALNKFKQEKASLSANASGVAASAGGSAQAKFQEGVAIFITSESGVMGELSLGGQTFKFEPYAGMKAPGT